MEKQIIKINVKRIKNLLYEEKTFIDGSKIITSLIGRFSTNLNKRLEESGLLK